MRHSIATAAAMALLAVSFGAALYTPGESVGQLITRADECLYMSKRNGRNRVTLETQMPPPAATNAA